MEIMTILSTAFSFLTSSLHPSLKPMAYLDPGSGSYLLQILLAALLGSLFIIRASWGRIKGLFTKKSPEEEIEEEGGEEYNPPSGIFS